MTIFIVVSRPRTAAIVARRAEELSPGSRVRHAAGQRWYDEQGEPRWVARCMRNYALVLALSLGLADSPRAQGVGTEFDHLYVLTFNAWGELLSPGERDLAREQLDRDRSIERIILFSYGWGHDGEASYADYRDMLIAIHQNLPPGHVRPRVAVIGVGWDSSQTGFRKLFNAIIPLPGLANALAWPLDSVFFPISFWSKAAQADRIGFGGLRTALNEIFSVYEEGDPHPEVFLIGHSFGTRIISGLMKPRLGPVDVSSNPFLAANHVRGAVLFQPALVGGNLDHEAAYPIMVTMSEHDHAVGFLYPLANVPLNAFGFTVFEALVQRMLIAPVQRGVETVQRGVETTASTVGDVITAPLPKPRSEPEPEAEDEESEPTSEEQPDPEPREPEGSMVERTAHKGRRTLGELLALPVNLAFTLVSLPFDYLYIQTEGLMTHPIDHVMDTLAQLPLVELPVDGLGRLTGREVPWGRRSKGFFTLGSLHEGMGRMSPPLALYPDPEVYSPAELDALETMPRGVFVVDASEVIDAGSFGSLGNPLLDYTLGWLDPLGAHSDFTNPDAIELAAWMASGGRLELRHRVPSEAPAASEGDPLGAAREEETPQASVAQPPVDLEGAVEDDEREADRDRRGQAVVEVSADP
jgi:hypothetical protein